MPKLDRSILEKPGLDRTLGMEYLSASPIEVTARLLVDERHLQPFGYLHGGVSVALAESVASVGASLAAPEGFIAFGQEINANHLRPVMSGATLFFSARPLHIGQRSQVWGIEIKNEEKLICVSRCTLAIVPINTA